ncbi:MAG: hypothetical protein ACOH1O_12325 [Flavobacterium sp.]
MSLDFIVFAQPGSNNGAGDLEGDDDDVVATPINGKLIWLMIVGITFALYTYRKNKAVKAA